MGTMLDLFDALLLGGLVSIIFLIFAEWRARRRQERLSWLRRLMLLGMGLYLSVVFALTIVPEYGWCWPTLDAHVNLQPFQALQGSRLNFFGNIILFMPLGFFLVLISQKCRRLSICLLIGCTISLAIEFLQLFILRETDIDDILLNALGTALGFFLAQSLLAAIPALSQKIGVKKYIGGQLWPKKNDVGAVVVLALCVAFAVLLGDYALPVQGRSVYASADFMEKTAMFIPLCRESMISILWNR